MIVKCINEDGYWTLRVNKEYEVLRQTKDRYIIVDEEGDEYPYLKGLFKVIDTGRNFTLSSISNEELLEELKRRMCK